MSEKGTIKKYDVRHYLKMRTHAQNKHMCVHEEVLSTTWLKSLTTFLTCLGLYNYSSCIKLQAMRDNRNLDEMLINFCLLKYIDHGILKLQLSPLSKNDCVMLKITLA